jgi:hypothetical protein
MSLSLEELENLLVALDMAINAETNDSTWLFTLYDRIAQERDERWVKERSQ